MPKATNLDTIRTSLQQEARPAREGLDRFVHTLHEDAETGLVVLQVWTYNSKNGTPLNNRNWVKWEHLLIGTGDGYWEDEPHLAYDSDCQYGALTCTDTEIAIERKGYTVTHWEIRIPFEPLKINKAALVPYGQPMPKR